MNLNLPSFNETTAISKSSILDEDAFIKYVSLWGLKIKAIELNYYILEGPIDQIKDFNKYWNYNTS